MSEEDQDFSDHPWGKLLPNPDFFVQLEEINRKLKEIQEQQLVTAQVLELLDFGRMEEILEQQAAILRQAEDFKKMIEADTANQEIFLRNIEAEHQRISRENFALVEEIKVLLDTGEDIDSIFPW